METKQKPGQVPKLEDLRAELSELDGEINTLNQQLTDSGDEATRIRKNLNESDRMLEADIGRMHAEHKGSFSGFLDKVFKKKVDGRKQLHTSLKKLEAVQGHLKSEIRNKRKKAEAVRKTIGEWDSIQRVNDALRSGMEFSTDAEKLLIKYEAFQRAVMACSEDEITKHFPKFGFPSVLLVYLTSHFKPAQAGQTPMFQAIANAMRLTAWGTPLIKQRAKEMFKVSEYAGQERQSLVREAQ